MHRQVPDNIMLNTNPSAQRGRGGGRSPGMRVLSQSSSGALRRTARGGAQNMTFPETYSGGSFMPRPVDYYSFRVPHMPPPLQATQMQSFNLPSRHETFGSQMDYNLSWTPNDMDTSNPVDTRFLMAAHAQHKNQTGKYFTKEASKSGPARFEQSDSEPALVDSRYLLKQQTVRDADLIESQKRSPKNESLLEWFDRTVESELQRRRVASLNVGENMINLNSPSFGPLNRKKAVTRSNPSLAEACASGVDINASLRQEKDTELLVAVDKLAKAEAMCVFEGAVRAAEEAAASAPPEYAEEAAAAGAQGFEARLTGVVKQKIDGVKPIEVIGYVGITRPNKPKKSN